MELCRNQRSGKYFIYIEEIVGSEKGLFVTPRREIKALELRLFDEPIEQEQYSTLQTGLVTDFQIRRYRDHERNRQEDTDRKKKERVKEYTYRQLIEKVKQLPPNELSKLRELLVTWQRQYWRSL